VLDFWLVLIYIECISICLSRLLLSVGSFLVREFSLFMILQRSLVSQITRFRPITSFFTPITRSIQPIRFFSVEDAVRAKRAAVKDAPVQQPLWDKVSQDLFFTEIIRTMWVCSLSDTGTVV
jgi:hypothetical protein